MKNLDSICKLADVYIAIAAEETGAAVPHPLLGPPEPGEPTIDPGFMAQRKEQEMPGLENVPGFDYFYEAMTQLRNAVGYMAEIKPVTYRVFAVHKLILDASRRIDAGLKEVYKATPEDQLQAVK